MMLYPLYKFVYSQYETFDYANTIPKNPQYVAADVCAEILKNNSSVDKRVDDLILIACSKNSQVAAYFSGEKNDKDKLQSTYSQRHFTSKSEYKTNWKKSCNFTMV